MLGLVLFLAAAAPASADTAIAVLGDTLFISAEGQNNSMEFKVVNQKYRTVDSGSILVAETGCVREPPPTRPRSTAPGTSSRRSSGWATAKTTSRPPTTSSSS